MAVTVHYTHGYGRWLILIKFIASFAWLLVILLALGAFLGYLSSFTIMEIHAQRQSIESHHRGPNPIVLGSRPCGPRPPNQSPI